jgi:hypothetical protein
MFLKYFRVSHFSSVCVCLILYILVGYSGVYNSEFYTRLQHSFKLVSNLRDWVKVFKTPGVWNSM